MVNHCTRTTAIVAMAAWMMAVRAGQAFFFLMSQYTPVAGGPQRLLTETEHRQMREYLEVSAFEDGFCQNLCAATEEMIPQFKKTGV